MRVTLEQARAFSAKMGKGSMVHTSFKYLEMADGNEMLARQIADYYQGSGVEKEYTVGEVIRKFWEGRRVDG